MEPKSQNQFEQGGVSTEFQPSLPTPEIGKSEQGERAPERETAQQPAVTQTPVPTSVPLPTPVQGDDTQVAAPSDDSPDVAADEDLIEKEWVDKAKKIIAETKDDPYRREREVNRLQADYLEKRYGKRLGKEE